MTRLLQKITGGYGFESAAQAARVLLARYDTDRNGVLDKAEVAALKAELDNCITNPFFVFLTSPIIQPGESWRASVALCACSGACVRWFPKRIPAPLMARALGLNDGRAVMMIPVALALSLQVGC